SRGAVPELFRLAIGAARAEDRLELTELAAVAHDHFHVGEGLEEQHLPSTHPGQRPLFAVGVHEQVGPRFLEIEALEIAEINRVRGRGPAAAEGVGIRYLEPQAAPTARGMAGHEPRRGLVETAKFLLDVRNQLLDQGLAARTVVGRVREDVMTRLAIGIEYNVKHLDAGHVGRVAPLGPDESREMVAAEAG